jgi:O-antigen/teichoic acid export membrane protein
VPVWVLLPGVLIRVVSKILPAYFSGTNRPGITSLAMAVAIAINIALMQWLLPLYGLIGVALSMSIGYLVESTIMAAAFVRFSGVPVRDLILLRRADGAKVLSAVRGVLDRFRGPRPVTSRER